jgi:hypothetical protein
VGTKRPAVEYRGFVSCTFTEYVRGAGGDAPQGWPRFDDVLKSLRNVLVQELKRRDLWTAPFPSYGAEAARALVEQRKVGVLGVDTASIDHGPSKDFIVHQIANGANVPGLENIWVRSRPPGPG